MKYFSISIFMIFLLCCFMLSFARTSFKIYDQAEAKFYAKYTKFASCAKKPLLKTCKICIDPGDSFKLFYYYQMQRLDKYDYNILIHYSDIKKEVIISFAGPIISDTNFPYIRYIYSTGFSKIKLYNIKIEKEYYLIYYQKLRQILVEKINKMIRSGRKDYKFIFTGHSIGGSLSILAAFDLTKRNIINSEKNKVAVFTFGSLRIGDNNFVKLINLSVMLFKITKSNDLIIRMPNCYYSESVKSWRCFTDHILTKFITTKNFPIKLYFRSYIKLKANNKSKTTHKTEIMKSILQSYKKYIYFSQPMGQQLLYDDNMISYKKCKYIDGIPLCEKNLKFPSSFTSIPHNNYFNIDFLKC